jgi:hypothetical protein
LLLRCGFSVAVDNKLDTGFLINSAVSLRIIGGNIALLFTSKAASLGNKLPQLVGRDTRTVSTYAARRCTAARPRVLPIKGVVLVEEGAVYLPEALPRAAV